MTLQSDVVIVKNVNRKLEEEKNRKKQENLEKKRPKGSNIASETMQKYQVYQTAFLMRILNTQ